MILYIANKNSSSWSLRPWILMRELGIPFDEQLVPFRDGSSYERFREFSPTGCLPCLHAGVDVVWDSMAINEYLAEHDPRVWPSDPHARAWARSAAAEMHAGFPALRLACPMNCASRIELSFLGNDLKRDLERIDEVWNDGLRRFSGPYLAGSHFTAVDAAFAPVAFRMRSYGLTVGLEAARYLARLLALNSMREWDAAARAELEN